MPLAMRKKVFITAALTGSGSTQDRSDKVPRSPEQIANDAIEAAKAGAAVVHCHVRDPETGAPARDASRSTCWVRSQTLTPRCARCQPDRPGRGGNGQLELL